MKRRPTVVRSWSTLSFAIAFAFFTACNQKAPAPQTLDVGELLKKGDYQAALVQLSGALVENPRDANILYNLALVQRQMGKTEDARRTLSKAQSYAPNDDNITLLLAETTLDRGNEQMAWDEFVKLSEPGRQTHRAQYIKGIIHSRMGDYPQAEAAFRTAALLGEKNPTNHAALAFAVIKQGRVEDGRKILQEAEAMPSPSIDARHQIAESYLAMGDAKKAQEIALALQKERPGDARILTLLGKAEMILLRFGEAESAFTQALSAPNATPWTQVSYAEMLFAAQREDEALAKAIEAEEKLILTGEPVRNPALYNLMATLYARKNQPLLARKYLNLSLQVKPLQPKVVELLRKMDQQ